MPESPPPASSSALPHYFRKFYRYFGKRFLVVIALSLIVAAAELTAMFSLYSVFFGKAPAGGPPNGPPEAGVSTGGFSWSLVLFGSALLLKTIFEIATSVYRSFLSADLKFNMRSRLLAAMGHCGYREMRRLDRGKLHGLLSNEAEYFNAAVSYYASSVAGFAVLVVFLTGIVWINARLTLLLLVACVVAALAMLKIGKLGVKTSQDYAESRQDAQARFREFGVSLKYIRATRLYQNFLAPLMESFSRERVMEKKGYLIYGGASLMTRLLGFVLIGTILAIEKFVFSVPIAELAIYSVVAWRAYAHFSALQLNWEKFHSSLGSIKVFEEALELLECNPEEPSGKPAVETASLGDITCENLTLYHDEKPILRNVNYRFELGKIYGIVGASGSGKTSFLDVLCGLMAPESGTVTAKNEQGDAIPLTSYRVGYMLQHAIVFTGTLSQNVTLYDCDASAEDKAQTMLDQAGLPNPASDKVGEGGIALSGGEAQRLAFARELYRDPQLMILDEPTGELDAESEQRLLQCIHASKEGRITILVTHKPTALGICDATLLCENQTLVSR